MTEPTTVFVLFGATGDLARRMVIPAFYHLSRRGMLPKQWLLVGNGRGDVSHEDFQQRALDAVTEFASEPDETEWAAFAKNLRFAGGGFEKSDPGSLLDVIAEAGEAQYIHYLAIPPTAFLTITEGLAEHSLAEGSRVVFEKPYGTSPENFRELDAAVHDVLDESQVYRIDHFLGKHAVQKLRSARLANAMLASTWNRDSVSEVQIDAMETLDVVDRIEFYDATGALLDMIVTHLFQVAAEIAMEPPLSLGADDLRDARESVIAAFRPLAPEDVVLGQFEGYTEIEGVKSGSTTDTFVAVRLWIDTDRWRGVPFLLRSGKQLAADTEQVNLVFRKPDGPYRHSTPVVGNALSVDLADGGDFAVELVVADTPVRAVLPEPDEPLPSYVRLIADVIAADRSLFTTPEGLEAAWSTIAPILDDRPEVHDYERGSWGPAAARDLAGPEGWITGS